MVMPKPDLTALTGGYRKTPVLQIGADIYCDTRLIATELERRYPAPHSIPGRPPRVCRWRLRAWSDPLSLSRRRIVDGAQQARLPEAVIADRKAFFNFMDFDTLEAEIPHLTTQFRAQADLVEQQLGDGRDFLFGDAPGLADIHAYFPVWMARGNVPGGRLDIFVLRPDAGLGGADRWPWDTARALPMSCRGRHEVARNSAPSPGLGVDPADALGLAAGDRCRSRGRRLRPRSCRRGSLDPVAS